MELGGKCVLGFVECCCLLVFIPLFTTAIYSLQSEEDGNGNLDNVIIILPILIILGACCICMTCIHGIALGKAPRAKSR